VTWPVVTLTRSEMRIDTVFGVIVVPVDKREAYAETNSVMEIPKTNKSEEAKTC
jgi:hypothetical protein